MKFSLSGTNQFGNDPSDMDKLAAEIFKKSLTEKSQAIANEPVRRENSFADTANNLNEESMIARGERISAEKMQKRKEAITKYAKTFRKEDPVKYARSIGKKEGLPKHLVDELVKHAKQAKSNR